METLTVKEYDIIMANPDFKDRDKMAYLPEKPFRSLVEFVEGFGGDDVSTDALEFCHIGFRRNIGETVSVSNYVGTIQTGAGYQIEILPKVSLSQNDDNNEGTKTIFMQMLRAMHGFPEKVLSDAKLRTTKLNLYEVFIRMYAEGVRELVKKGLKSAYVAREDNLNRFKGKLLIRDHIRYNLAHRERFYVGFDEYHIDRPENRIIKATLEKLLRLSRSAANQRDIRELLVSFELVEPSFNHADEFSKITIDRSTKQYEEVLAWSRVFLMNESFSTFTGSASARSLLFPMEKVFESYVAKKLKRALADTGWRVKAQSWGKYLFDEPKKFALSPDIVVERDDGSIVILDTKWKALNENPGANYGISQSDMYQMFAYSHRYNTSEIWLLYPLNENVRDIAAADTIEFKNDDPVSVRVFFVDLERMDSSMEKLKSMLVKKERSDKVDTSDYSDAFGGENMETPDFVKEFIDSESWTFAKTYADRAPHEYVVRGKQKSTDEEYMAVVNYIAKKGVTMHFWNHPNRYIFVDGYQYWVMKDSDDDPSMVLNRCNLNLYKLSIEWTGKKA